MNHSKTLVIDDRSFEAVAPQVLSLTLEITDPEVIAELSRLPEGRERKRFAAQALRIGVLASRSASGALDVESIRNAGDQLLAEVRSLLIKEGASMTTSMADTLRGYLDPDHGSLPQRIHKLTEDGGELERLLADHVGADNSKLAQTLAQAIGEHSPLLKMLAPDAADGLLARLQSRLGDALAEQRSQILREFSLDNKDSALNNLLGELGSKHESMCKEVGDQADGLMRELSLDHPDSALSRLVSRVEGAQKTLTQEFSLDDERSAMSRLAKLIGSLEKKQTAFHSEVRESIAALRAQRDEAERSTRHGHVFQDQLASLLSGIAQGYADPFEDTGNRTGCIKNCKVGDFVVELAADSLGAGARIVWEAKEDQSYNLSKALAEMETARKNRKAQIGVFVFSRKSAPDNLDSFARYGDNFVIVWDADDAQSDVYIKAAYAAARALVQAENNSSESRGAVIDEVERATRAIEKQIQYLSDFQKDAGSIESRAQKIADRARKMARELTRQVECLDEELAALKVE